MLTRRVADPRNQGFQELAVTDRKVGRIPFCNFSAISLSVAGVNDREIADMASITKRRNGDGSTSWDALVRVVGYPATGKSFRTKLAAELWAARTEAAAKGGTLASSRRMTFGQLLDEALPRLSSPTAAIFAYWREHFGDMRLEKITPEHVASMAAASSGAGIETGHDRGAHRAARRAWRRVIARDVVSRGLAR